MIAAVALALFAAPNPLPAAEVIARAKTQAAREGKNVLVKFGASWCPWCRRFDALLADERFGRRFRESYVIAPITIRERNERRKEENPGWPTVLQALRGAPERDVPYLVVLSPTGEKLGDSYRPPTGKIPGNAGFPRTVEEIDAFVGLISRTGRAFTTDDQAELKKYFAQG